ncbi:MAG: heme-binding domain-containing protein [Elusimicrobia bacterium]|nr:heme-binding domain-containing protein [Elusimicrobiota bacterium]
MRTAFVVVGFFLAGSYALAHKGAAHPEAVPAPAGAGALSRVNEAYKLKVRPIFFVKCFDCHGAGRPLPWYFAVPGAKQLMLYDMRTAKKHLDMRSDFPFGGHGSPLENLSAISEVVEDGSMPPWYYRIVRRGSALTPDEAAAVRAWIAEAKSSLGLEKRLSPQE